MVEGVGAVHGGNGGNGRDVAVEEDGEGWIAASGRLFLASASDGSSRGGGSVIVGGGRNGGALDDYGIFVILILAHDH